MNYVWIFDGKSRTMIVVRATNPQFCSRMTRKAFYVIHLVTQVYTKSISVTRGRLYLPLDGGGMILAENRVHMME